MDGQGSQGHGLSFSSTRSIITTTLRPSAADRPHGSQRPMFSTSWNTTVTILGSTISSGRSGVAAGVTVEIDRSVSGLPVLTAERRAVRQILLNLLSNA